jgi:hypothetical protein
MLMDNKPIRGGPDNHKELEGSHDLLKDGVEGGKGRETGASEARERHGEGGRRGGRTGRMEEGEETRRTDGRQLDGNTEQGAKQSNAKKQRAKAELLDFQARLAPHTLPARRHGGPLNSRASGARPHPKTWGTELSGPLAARFSTGGRASG